MIEDDMVNDALIQEALQYIADHGKVHYQPAYLEVRE